MSDDDDPYGNRDWRWDLADGDTGDASSAPGWFDKARQFFDNPVGYILTAVLGWFVGTLISGLEWTLAAFWGVVDFTSRLVIDLAGAFLIPISRLFGIILTSVELIQNANTSLVAGLGPLAPIVATLVVVIEVLAVLYFVDMVYQAITEIAGSIPFVGGIITALTRGLRSFLHTIRGLVGVMT